MRRENEFRFEPIELCENFQEEAEIQFWGSGKRSRLE